MANPYFGNVGDVWKHLALAALLEAERPARYYESHAGSASYPVADAARRACDFRHFAEWAPRSPLLGRSAYLALLRDGIAGEGAGARYPGSPLIAMQLLGQAGTDFLFADLDGESLRTISEAARRLGLDDARLGLICGDGLAALAGLAAPWGRETLAFLDPFDPLERSEGGRSSLMLLGHLARQGVRVALWYPIHTEPQLALVRSGLAAAFGGTTNPPPWCGEIRLTEAIGDQAGLLGCGIAVANAGAPSLEHCEHLGGALANILTGASFATPEL